MPNRREGRYEIVAARPVADLEPVRSRSSQMNCQLEDRIAELGEELGDPERGHRGTGRAKGRRVRAPAPS